MLPAARFIFPLLALTWACLHPALAAEPHAEALARARAGDFTTAIPALEALAAAGNAAAAADLVAVYTWAGRPADALAAWSRLPADQRPAYVQADAARALAALGGGLGARALLGQPDPEIDARAAASLVRLAPVEPVESAPRFAAVDRALAELDRQLAAARTQTPTDAGLIRRLTFDRWVVLEARVRMADLAAEFDRWPEPPTALPPYALAAAGAALLYLEQPERARDLYREARRRAPDDREIALGLFYAEIECENFPAVYALIDALDAAEPAAVRYATEGAPRDNPHKLGLTVTAALARYYGDEPRAAWRRLAPLAAGAPGNGYVRREAAAVMSALGWRARARAELARVEALDPGEPATRQARVEHDLAARHYRAAGPAIAALAAASPESKSVQRLVRDWALLQRPEFFASFQSESGGSPDQRGTDYRAYAEVWSPPLATDWRLMAAYAYTAAELPEGDVTLRVPTVGLEFRRGDFDLLARVGQLDSIHDHTFATARARWRIADAWSAEFFAGRNHPETPLRALYYGLTSDRLATSLAWTPIAGRSLSLGAQAAKFSSGNRRAEWSAAWHERIYERPHLDLDLVPDASLQTNSRLGEPYYNPTRVFDAGLALEATHVLHRRYRASWVHQGTLRLGSRAERGFGSGATWSARYELRRAVSDALAMTAAIATGNARYDGTAERFTRWELTAYGRF